jgi:integrase/recombinase XerD
VLVIESLKKRRTGIYQSVPMSPVLLDALDLAHGIHELQFRRGKGHTIRLWPWLRMPGWRAVHGRDAGGRTGRVTRLAQGAAAIARPRPAHHHRHLPMPSAPRKRILPAECGDERPLSPVASMPWKTQSEWLISPMTKNRITDAE